MCGGCFLFLGEYQLQFRKYVLRELHGCSYLYWLRDYWN